MPAVSMADLTCWTNSHAAAWGSSVPSGISKSNASATGTVGLELQDDGTAIPGSESEATISTTNNLAPLGASVLVNAGAGSVITLNAAEANTTITNASVTVQKLD